MTFGINHKHLAQSVLLEESGNPLVVRVVISFGALLVALFIIWALIAEVDEVAVANGEIVPQSKLRQVQNNEGGRIIEILVREGEQVQKDQVVLRFDSFSIKSELREIEAQRQTMLAQRERLDAFLHDRPLPASSREDGTTGAPLAQALLLKQLLATREAGKAIYNDRVGQIKASIAEISGRTRFLDEKKATLNEESNMRTTLLEKGMSTKLQILNLRRQLADVESELADIGPKRIRLEREMDEAANQLRKNESDVRERALTELSRTNDDLAKADEQIKRLEERLRQSEVRAPADGYVHGLKTHTIGGVIARGEIILEVVPKERNLVAEVHIAPRDVGHVKVGQKVKLRMTAFDFSRYGIAHGELTDISHAAFLDKSGAPYHRGIVRLDQDYVGNIPGAYPIIAGMTLSADIRTGSKTVMTYLLKPIYTSAKQAFRER